MLSQKRIENLTNMIIKEFWANPNIAEIYSENSILKSKVIDIFNKHCKVDQKIEEEVKKKLKHLQPGTLDYEIEFNKLVEDIKKMRKLK